jgi:UDP-N-acetylmuramate--alanine ligase
MHTRMSLQDWTGKRIHFIGIGGAGMSGLARICLSLGLNTSGSDAKDSSVVTALKALGAEIFVGHDANHVRVINSTINSRTSVSCSHVHK